MPKRHVEKSDGVASELNLDEPSLRFDIEHIEINVGKRLRTLRGERGLSIRGLAGKSGLAVNTLSLIENGKTSPSVSTLQQLAEALKVPITAFFKPDMEQKFVVHTPLAERPHTEIEKALLQDLGAGLATRAVQPLVVTLKKGGGSGTMPIVHTGYEFVYCLNGRILYTIDGQPYLLNPPRIFHRTKAPCFLRTDEIQQLFDHMTLSTPADLRTNAIIHIAYTMGLRPQEICRLTLDDIQFSKAETPARRA